MHGSEEVFLGKLWVLESDRNWFPAETETETEYSAVASVSAETETETETHVVKKKIP